MVNATDAEQKLDLNLTGATVNGPSTLWQMTGKDLDAANHVGQPAQVEIRQVPIDSAPKTLTIAPISINIYRFQLVH